MRKKAVTYASAFSLLQLRCSTLTRAILFLFPERSLFVLFCSSVNANLVSWGQDIGANPPAGDYITVAAGGDDGLALRADGTVVAWGGKNT